MTWPSLQEIGQRVFGEGGRVERPSDRFNEHRAALIFRDRFGKTDQYMHDEFQYALMDGFYIDGNLRVGSYVEVKSRPGRDTDTFGECLLNVRKWTQMSNAQNANAHLPHYFLDQYEAVLFYAKVSDLAAMIVEKRLKPKMIFDSRSVQRTTSNEPCYTLPRSVFKQIDIASVQMSDDSRIVLAKCWQDLQGKAA